jgi:hypothetical protein
MPETNCPPAVETAPLPQSRICVSDDADLAELAASIREEHSVDGAAVRRSRRA